MSLGWEPQPDISPVSVPRIPGRISGLPGGPGCAAELETCLRGALPRHPLGRPSARPLGTDALASAEPSWAQSGVSAASSLLATYLPQPLPGKDWLPGPGGPNTLHPWLPGVM